MKKFVNAEISEVMISETAFGPVNPDKVDADKYAVTDENGNVLGYEELYGESGKISG